jgi:hypothetical protein
MTTMFEAARAEALFASTLQRSHHPAGGEVREAVTTTLRIFGVRGCAAQVAGEFGEHPETAVARMRWVLSVIRTVYPTPPSRQSSHATPSPNALALAG